jgi:arylsulfatase A-like enzyme
VRRVLPVVLVLAFACTPGGIVRRTSEPNERPNVLIVVTDDERFDSHEATPQLYKWFSEGTIFQRAYATTPHCCPSRASIFSGRYVHNHKVEHQSKIKLLDHDRTVQHELKEAGYRTGFVGKFINGWNPTKAPPNFDRWTVGEGYHGAGFVADGARQRVNYGPTWVFQRGRKYIEDWEKSDAAPWLLMVSTFAPHDPTDAQREYEDATYEWDGTPATKETDRGDKPPYVRLSDYSEGYGIEKRQAQFRTLRSVDDAFMKTIEHLEEHGELDNTLVIYLSDNGYLWAEHGLISKGVPYDGSTRIPLYVRGPGIERATSNRIVANIDVAPTVYDATGIRPSYEVDGRPLLRSQRDALLLEYAGGKTVPRWSSIVKDDLQYTEYADGFRELYDLEDDPFQLQNDPAKITPEIVTELARAKTCVGAACP